ncbi:ubiquitin-specific protease ubp1 [Fusarium falciforme]|uniref:ubiquitinyl hydrolase 1 n=1 Tax=Fusarium falciforme TaxID=195108 RepID=A0A9W8R427_9HYPO|nr:ubiquitin-specific protease ubp1 [Fusarium falciforme]
MTHQERLEFEDLYDNFVTAHRRPYHRESTWDKITQPSILLSVLIVAVTVGYNFYATSATLREWIQLLGRCFWDALVAIVPERLLDVFDTPDTSISTSTSKSMLHDDKSAHAAKSERLRRVMGLDSSRGMMASVFQVRNRALSMTGGVLGLKLDGDHPPGLGNMDNSCYQNSILQGLSSLKPLPEYLSACLEASDNEDVDRDVAQTLRTLINDLNDVSNYGRTLWTPGLLKSMSTFTQQDAQEYFSKILDDVDKSVAKALKSAQPRNPGLAAKVEKDDTAASEHSDDSGYQSLSSSGTLDNKLPRNPLEGLLAQRVACIQCGHSDGLSMIPFTCLTLSLGLDKNRHDLYERLDAYSKVEAIENVECAKCTLLKAQKLLSILVERLRETGKTDEQLAEPLRRLEAVELALEEDDFEEKTLTEKCKISQQSKVSTTKTKQIVVARPPQSLAIHMQRSVFDPSTFNMMKNSAPVNYPMTLDLGPWCLGSTGEAIPNSGTDENTEDGEKWTSDPRQSMIAGDLGVSRLTGPIYELRAVVTHYGRHENGHYICYRKYPRHSPPTKAVEDEVSSEPGDRAEAEVSTKVQGKQEDGESEMDWWRLSDHNVSMVSEETVLSLSPGVFMLFYDCVDPTMVLTEDVKMQDADEVTNEVAVAVTDTPTEQAGMENQVEQGVDSQATNGEAEEKCVGEDAAPLPCAEGDAETETGGLNMDEDKGGVEAEIASQKPAEEERAEKSGGKKAKRKKKRRKN